MKLWYDGLTDDQLEYIGWVNRCHRPLLQKERDAWIAFYQNYFRYLNEASVDYIRKNEPHYLYLKGEEHVPEQTISAPADLPPSDDRKVIMKYLGPLAVTEDEIQIVATICKEANLLFYYWNIPGEQYFAFSPNFLKMKHIPLKFHGMHRDTPYA
jgi:hypothetical protein